jgi:DNA-binding NtrC family response regulator
MLLEMAPDAGARRVSEGAWKVLAGHSWPGNVRELRGAVSRAVTLGGEELQAADFFPQLGALGQFGRSPQFDLLADVDADKLVPYQAMLRGAMEQALIRFGTIRAAAEHLGMAKSTFADKARAWGLVPRKKVKLPKFPIKTTEDVEQVDLTDEMESEDLSIVRDGIVAHAVE